ncbi:MAG TPA: sugar ABC transporter permease [Spirochaetia bacterium]|nr:sugar ABC transporter permease [Spirochaetia bacterium]
MAFQRRPKTLYDISFLKALPFLALPIGLYVFMMIVPLLGAFYFSLNHIFGNRFTFVGLRNFQHLLSDPIVLLALKNNAIFILVSIVFQVGPAFIIMSLIATRLVYGSNAVRAIFFFPVVVSPLVTAYVWKIMYNPDFGVLNGIIRALGAHNFQRDWLSDPKFIITSISIPLAWQYIGYYLILLLAGFTSIDPGLLEAAEIDGATGGQRTRFIIWPLMRNTLNVCLLLCVSGGLNIFSQVYAMSGGGPGYTSTVLSMYAFTNSFENADFGYGATISISMLIIGFAVVVVLLTLRRNTEAE